MKKVILLFAIIAVTLATSCTKEKTIAIDSKQLIFNVDSVPVAGPLKETSVAKYDVDEFAKQNKINLGSFKEFKFKNILFKITAGNLRFDDYKFIKISIKTANKSEKEIVTQVDIPVGTDKEFTVTAIPNVNVLEYAQDGDVTMTFFTETKADHTPEGTITALPSIDALGITGGLFK